MKHTENEAVRALRKKRDVRIEAPFIYVLKDKVLHKELGVIDNTRKVHDLGNGSWGRIDFLIKVLEYKLLKVNTF